MAETPKTREELMKWAAKKAFGSHKHNLTPEWIYVERAAKVIEAIESLGLRIVPVEPTQGMLEAGDPGGNFEPPFRQMIEMYQKMMTSNPFAPEQDNG